MFENVYLLHQMESILQRTIKRSHKRIVIGKNIDDKNILATLKKHS